MAIVNSYVSLPDGYSGHIPHATEEVPYISVCGISLGDYQDPKCRNPPSLENHLPEGWQFHIAKITMFGPWLNKLPVG